jgi:hypothetical protein
VVPPDVPTIDEAGIGDQKVTLEWSNSNRIDILYYPGTDKPIGPTDSDTLPEEIDSEDIVTFIEDTDTGEAAMDAGVSDQDGGTDADAKSTARSIVQVTLASEEEEEDSEDDESAEVECPNGGFDEGDEYHPDGEYGVVSTTLGASSGTVTGLTNGEAYKFGLVAKDDFNNRSEVSEVVCLMPSETVDFWEIYNESGGSGGNFCFIATAAFGSYDHPMVQVLRAFRDRFLAKLPFGSQLIQTYYAAGPAMADAVDKSSALRGIAVGGLSIIALMTVPFTILTPFGTLIALTLLLGFSWYRRRRTS